MEGAERPVPENPELPQVGDGRSGAGQPGRSGALSDLPIGQVGAAHLRAQSEPPSIPGYEIEGVLGRGSTGIVYKARQLAVDREAAVKVLHPELAKKRRVVLRLQREARTTARLAHPHIVSAIDMGEVDGVWWYAMEFVDGPTLAERLKREGRLGEREALRLFIPLCEALVHAWEHGVVHRDIKPANILIDRVRGARLADLGLAFMDDDPSLTGSEGTLGTPHYMSPEQARSPADADVRSDIWSFGATLFHTVCGRTPFSGESLAEVLSGVLYARVPDPARLEPRLTKGMVLILRKCLSRDPVVRYQTPREMLLDLERVRERRLPKVARRMLDPVDRGARPGLRAALAIAATAVVATALLASVWWNQREASGTAEQRAREFPPLIALADRVRELPEDTSPQLHSLMTELLVLEDEVPAEERARWISLRTELRGRLRSAVTELLREVGSETERQIRAEDYRGAFELVADFGARLYERTGYTLEALPADQVGVASTRLDFLRTSVETAAANAASSLRRVLERHLDDVLFPQVAILSGAGRWRSAHEELDLDDAELLRLASYSDAHFPKDVVEEQLDEIRLALFARRAELTADWGRIDQDLRRWVTQRAGVLEQRLRADPSVAGRAAELERAFEYELERRGLVPPAERHPAGLPFATGELEARARSLETLEDTLREQRTREDFDVLRGLSRPLWGLREYAGLRDRFDGFARHVRGLPGDEAAAWRVDLLDRMTLEQREAELLAALLRRAASALEELQGRTTRLRLGSITLTGEVVLSGDVLAEGFLFRTAPETERRVYLRSLPPGEVERLAGLRPEGELPSDPSERLLVALFRFHEGQFEAAHTVLIEGPTPSSSEDRRLAARLSERVLAAMEDRAIEHAERADDAAFLLTAVGEMQYDRSTILGFVEQLLGEFGDIPSVRARRGELRSLRERLSRPEPEATLLDLAQAFFLPDSGPGVVAPVSRADRDRVRLRFGFASESGAWQRGDWATDGEGWTAPPAERLEDLTEGGVRLALRRPLAPLRGEIELLLRIEQPYDSGPPRCLVVTLAGYHVALIGPSLSPEGPRWLLGTGTLTELLERIAAGEGVTVPGLLLQGQRHELRVVVSHRPGSIEFQLDGRTIHSGAMTAPTLSGTPQVVLRSWEKVRLLSAEVVAVME